MEIIKYKYIFTFYKKGWLIFISHLNLMRLYERAFKKANLPVVYSQGFNPHMRLSLPFPLPLGYIGQNEIGEIYLYQKIDPEEFIKKANNHLPEDIQIISVEHKNIKNFNQLVSSYNYQVVFKSGFDVNELKNNLKQKEIIVEKINKKGKVSRLNLYDYLKYYDLKENKFNFTMLVREQKTIDVEQMLKTLAISTEMIEDIIRVNINCAAI